MRQALALGAMIALMVVGLARAAPDAVIVHGPAKAAQQVIAAEHHYSDLFGKVGMAKGMREFMDPKDGLAFTGGDPTRGPDVYAAYGGDAPSSLKLSWTPAEVFVSKSGDMAASWGRYVLDFGDPSKKPHTGRYVTVWRRTTRGDWKAIMDIGNPDSN